MALVLFEGLMFKCAITGKITKPREPLVRVVVETRPKTYVNYKWDEETGEKIRIESKGYETVREVNVSPEGMAILEGQARELQSLHDRHKV